MLVCHITFSIASADSQPETRRSSSGRKLGDPAIGSLKHGKQSNVLICIDENSGKGSWTEADMEMVWEALARRFSSSGRKRRRQTAVLAPRTRTGDWTKDARWSGMGRLGGLTAKETLDSFSIKPTWPDHWN